MNALSKTLSMGTAVIWAFFFSGNMGLCFADDRAGVETEGVVFSYFVKNDKSNELLFWVASSFQPELKTQNDFFRKHAEGVEFLWNRKIRALAISEENYRFMGRIWVLAKEEAEGAYVNVFTEQIQESILERTNLDVERYRFVVAGWKPDDKLEIILSLKYWLPEKVGETRQAFFKILFDSDKKNIVSIVQQP